jgi:DeoR/GlpR family transcriptional regulator of sugar metabolism
MTDNVWRYRDAGERRAWILSRLREIGFMSITDLTRELGVSQMTVRRDLHLLEACGHVRAMHSAGVGLVPRAQRRWTFPRDGSPDGRRRVARSAVRLINDNDVIAVDAGATAYELIRALPETYCGTIITHSMPVMQEVAERRVAERVAPPELVALGGDLLPTGHALAGPATLEAIARLRAHIFFLSAAVDERGIYAHSAAEASIQQGLIDIADEVVLLAPRESFSGSAPVRIGSLDRLTSAVMDRPPPDDVVAAFDRAGVKLHVDLA